MWNVNWLFMVHMMESSATFFVVILSYLQQGQECLLNVLLEYRLIFGKLLPLIVSVEHPVRLIKYVVWDTHIL